MEKQLSNNETGRRVPGFLKVLCILSFTGVGIALIMGIYNLLTLGSTLAQLKSSMDTLKSLGSSLGNGLDNYANSLIHYGTLYYIIIIVASLICLTGVMMMWKLRKSGYYIYILGEIAPAVAAYALLGGYGALGTALMIMGIVFPVAFIIMYGLNLKHLA
jgi:hypothetical protein